MKPRLADSWGAMTITNTTTERLNAVDLASAKNNGGGGSGWLFAVALVVPIVALFLV